MPGPTNPAPGTAAAPMPWVERQRAQLALQPGHAWLLQGAPGLGQYDLALQLAASGLCEAATPAAVPCGQCPSCHAIAVQAHADLLVLMPEVNLIEHGWPLDDKAQKEIDDKERKPSKEIRVEAVRQAIEFAQRTSGRGRGKVVILYPAERMNAVAANALLKTLEEPPGDTRFILATEAPHLLLPTLRSRCLTHSMHWPTEAEALAWLAESGLAGADAAVMWSASGGRPQAALSLASLGCTAATWQALPSALARGEVGLLADWPAARLLDVLQKLCHDLMCLATGAAPRFFEVQCLPRAPDLATLKDWSCELRDAARTVEHPWQPGLLLEAWVARASRVLQSAHAANTSAASLAANRAASPIRHPAGA